jgi:methylenetetrahydrofolate--tRNA-(uracil-5-)-methyltransferase
MKPVGLRDPRTGKRPHAVVQLRAEDDAAHRVQPRGLSDAHEVAGPARVLRMIPGLENAEFERSAACTATPS